MAKWEVIATLKAGKFFAKIEMLIDGMNVDEARDNFLIQFPCAVIKSVIYYGR